MSADTDELVFRGTAPALVTPFTREDELDEEAFRALVDWQIEEGAGALVVLGTTGENPTVSHEERRRLTDWAVDQAAGRVPVVMGTGTNSTRKSVKFSREAEEAGVDALLVVGPYYNKPTPEGVFAHVADIAGATDTPIILYNVPSRTGSNVGAETVLRLAEEVPQVRGIKEASGDLAQISDILAGRPDSLGVYAGDDEIAYPILALGGDGAVSVISNAVPAAFDAMVRAGLDGDLEEARRRHFDLLDAMRASFVQTNPIPIKSVLAEVGRIAPTLRLPLSPLSPQYREQVMDAFEPFLAE